jgi:hypothetical protein
MRMNTEDVTMTDKEKKETSQQNSHYIYPFASTLLIQIDFQFPMIFTPISHFSPNKFTSSSLQQNTYINHPNPFNKKHKNRKARTKDQS